MTQHIIIGFDTEFVPQGDGPNKNKPLSYQTYGIRPDGEWSWIDKREHFDKRPNLVHILSATILAGIEKGALSGWPSEIILAAHFTPADLPMLGGFGKLKLRLNAVRKCFVTFKPLTLKLYDRSRNAHSVRVAIRDTLLLAPQGHGSLESIGKLIDVEKMDLAAEGGDIRRMDQLLSDNPELFERYAIRDAEIAAKYIRTGRGRVWTRHHSNYPRWLRGQSPAGRVCQT